MENSKKLLIKSRDSLLKNSFWFGNESPCWKTSVEAKKIVLENSSKNLNQNWPKAPIYKGCQKLTVGARLACSSTGRLTSQRLYLWPLGLLIDRPVDRTQVLTCQSTGRSTEARTREHCFLAGRPGPDPESKLSGPQARLMHISCAHRSTAWSIEARTREQSSLAGRPPGQPGPAPENELLDRSTDPQAKAVCTFCAHRLTSRSTARRPGQCYLGIKTWSFNVL